MRGAAHRADDTKRQFLELFGQHRADLKAFIWSVVGDRGLCDDMLQEAALALWESFDRYDSSRAFGAWARGVTANIVLASLKRDRRWKRHGDAVVVDALLQAYERVSDDPAPPVDVVKSCIQQLPERSRRLLALRYDESLKLNEVADRVGSTMDAVRVALQRIRASLATCVRRKLAREGAS